MVHADQGTSAPELWAFDDAEVGWIQAHFSVGEIGPKLEFEAEGFEPGDFFLVSVVVGDVEMEIALLELQGENLAKAQFVLDAATWPMDFPKDLNTGAFMRVRDADDDILMEAPFAAK